MHLSDEQLHHLGHPGSLPQGNPHESVDGRPTVKFVPLEYLTARPKSLVQPLPQVGGCPSPRRPRKVSFCKQDAENGPSRNPEYNFFVAEQLPRRPSPLYRPPVPLPVLPQLLRWPEISPRGLLHRNQRAAEFRA